jgi:hypothetical protein
VAQERLSDRWTRRWRTEARLFWRRSEWGVLGSLWVLALALGMLGFNPRDANGEPRSAWDLLYLSLQLFTLESGAVDSPNVSAPLQIARFLAPVVAAWTLVKAIGSVFADQVQLMWSRTYRRHTVICGLGRTGALLASALTRRGESVIVIEKDPNGSFVAQAREQGAIVLIGDATETAMLGQARIDRASRLVSVCAPDSVNFEVAFQARSIANRPGRPLTCIIHVSEPQLWSWLRGLQPGIDENVRFRLESVNVYDAAARVCLDEHPPFAGATVGQTPHVLLIGLGRFGARILIQTARLWRDHPARGSNPLRVTIVDRRANELWPTLLVRYPQLQEVCAVTLVTGEVSSRTFQEGAFLFDGARSTCTVAYVCLEDEGVGFAAGLAVLRATPGHQFPVVIRLREEGGVARLVRSGTVGGMDLRRTRPIPLLGHGLTSIMLEGTNEFLARMLHAAYVRNQEEQGIRPEKNPSMVPWGDLPDELRESNRRQADHIAVKLRAIGCHLVSTDDWDIPTFEFTHDDVEKLARQEHERWMAERFDEGWTYAPGPKNIERKTSPFLVSWDELKPEQDGGPDPRDWDRAAVRAIPATLARAGFRIDCMPTDGAAGSMS